MEEKGKKQGTGCVITFLIIFGIIAVVFLVNNLIESQKSLDATKHEETLIKEGKTETHNQIINEIIEIMKEENEEKITEYLSSDFKYYNDNNIESKYISNFFSDLKILSTNYDIERRGDINKDDIVTYRIYWNLVEANSNWGRTSDYYCLQKITIQLKRVVKKDKITYEIENINLYNC